MRSPRCAEAVAWAVTVAAAAAAPTLSFAALAALVVLRWRGPESATAARRARRLAATWGWPVFAGVAALAAVHAWRATAWWDLAGIATLLLVGAFVRPDRHAWQRDGLLLGHLLLLSIHLAVVAVPAWASIGGVGGRAAGAASHPNVLGASMLCTAAALAVLAQRTTGARRGAALAGVLLSLTLLLASGSRAAIVGGAIGAVVWASAALLRWRRRGLHGGRPAVPVAALVTLAAAGIGPLVAAAIRRFPLGELLTTDVERGAVFSVALDLVAHRPVLGHGGVPWSALADVVEPGLPFGALVHAHSVLGHLLVHGGAAGLVLAVVMAIGAVRAGLPSLRAAAADLGGAAPVLAAAACGLALQGFVDLVLLNPAVYLAVAALLVTLTASAPTRTTTHRSRLGAA